ncbi:hypothetical protein FB45DRAFT_1006550 [Roridomyces roridus]|uniref:Uncharacterized protein n=1 Tax=Roridomyces roridus TaxID=1738132 RepID=A0AAD7FFL2_9AGAR|nr:hypothetical protein FB45DRAFT_1006550 [Roridomyces roridus]
MPKKADPVVSPTLREQAEQDLLLCSFPLRSSSPQRGEEDCARDSYPQAGDTVNPALLQIPPTTIPEAGGYEPYWHIADYAPPSQSSSPSKKRKWQLDDDDDYEPADNDSFSRNYPPASSTSRKKPKITGSSQAPTISRRDKPRRRKRSRTYERITTQAASSSRQIPDDTDTITLHRPPIMDQLGYLPLPGQRRDDAVLVLPETTVRRKAPSSRSMMSGEDVGSSVETFQENDGDQHTLDPIDTSTILRTEDLPGRRESGSELEFFFQEAAESSSPPKLEEQESESEVTLVEPPPSSRKKGKARVRERNPSSYASSSWQVPVQSLGGRRAAQQARTTITEQFGQAADVESFIGGAGPSSSKKRKRRDDDDEYDPSDTSPQESMGGFKFDSNTPFHTHDRQAGQALRSADEKIHPTPQGNNQRDVKRLRRQVLKMKLMSWNQRANTKSLGRQRLGKANGVPLAVASECLPAQVIVCGTKGLCMAMDQDIYVINVTTISVGQMRGSATGMTTPLLVEIREPEDLTK